MSTFESYLDFLAKQHLTVSTNTNARTALVLANSLLQEAKDSNDLLDSKTDFDNQISSKINAASTNSVEILEMINVSKDMLSAIRLGQGSIEPKATALKQLFNKRPFPKVQLTLEQMASINRLLERQNNNSTSNQAMRYVQELDTLIDEVNRDLKERDSIRIKNVYGAVCVLIGIIVLILFLGSLSEAVLGKIVAVVAVIIGLGIYFRISS